MHATQNQHQQSAAIFCSEDEIIPLLNVVNPQKRRFDEETGFYKSAKSRGRIIGISEENAVEVPFSIVDSTSLQEYYTTIVNLELSDFEKGIVAKQILNVANGIPKFISSIGASQSDDNVHETAAELMKYVLVNYSIYSDHYAAELVKWCLDILSSRSIEIAKTNALSVLIHVVNYCKCNDIDFTDITKDLHTMYSSSSYRYGTKANFLLLFCKICHKNSKFFSSATSPCWIYDEIMSILRYYGDDMYSNSNNRIILKACFDSLSALFVGIAPTRDIISITFNCLQSCINDDALFKPAGELFLSHFQMFQQFVINHYKLLCDLLISRIKSNIEPQLALACLHRLFQFICQNVRYEFDEGGIIPKILADTSAKDDNYGLLYALSASACFCSDLSIANVNYSIHPIYFFYLKLLNEGNWHEVYRLEYLSKICQYLTSPQKCHLSELTLNLTMNFKRKEQPIDVKDLSAAFGVWLGSIERLDMCLNLDYVIKKGLIYSAIQDNHLDFVDLWNQLLNINSAHSNYVARVMYNTILTNFFAIISNLDLTIVEVDANISVDFVIFNNLVDIFERIILYSRQEHLRCFITTIISSCTDYSYKYPSVVGFFKLIRTCFDAVKNGNEEQFLHNKSLSNFLKWAINRVAYQRGELLVSNIRMILRAPTCLLRECTHLLQKIVVTACTIGVRNSFVLFDIVDALNRWFSTFPHNEIVPLIAESLRILYPVIFRIAPRIGEKLDDHLVISAKTCGESRYSCQLSILNLQQKLLSFMFKVNVVVSPVEYVPHMSKNTTQCMEYCLPIFDGVLNVDLGAAMSRIVALTLTSCDRHVRLAACECIAAFILNGCENSELPYDSVDAIFMFVPLLDVALKLSVDHDVLVNKMFQRIPFKIIEVLLSLHHWPVVGEKVLYVLFSSLNSPNPMEIRDASARCLSQLFAECDKCPQWAVVIRREIFAQLNKNSQDRSQEKCVGAALVLNAIFDQSNIPINLQDWLDYRQYFIAFIENNLQDDDDIHVFSDLMNKINSKICQIAREDPTIILRVFENCFSVHKFVRESSRKLLKNLLPSIRYPSLSDVLSISAADIFTKLNCELSQSSIVGYADFILWLCEEGVQWNWSQAHQVIINMFVAASDLGLTQLKVIFNYILFFSCNSAEIIRASIKIITCGRYDLDNPDLCNYLVRILSSTEFGALQYQFIIPTDFQKACFKQDITKICHLWKGMKLLVTAGVFQNNWLSIVSEVLFDNAVLSSAFSHDRRIHLCYDDIIKFIRDNNEGAPQFLLELILDDSLVTIDDIQLEKGKYIYLNFKSAVLSSIIKMDASVILTLGEKGLALIVGMLNWYAIGPNHSLDAKIFAEDVVENWQTSLVHSYNVEQKLELMQLLMKVLASRSSGAHNILKDDFLAISQQNLKGSAIIQWFDLLKYFEFSTVDMSYIESKLRLLKEFAAGNDLALMQSVAKDTQKAMSINSNAAIFSYFVNAVAEYPLLLSEEALYAFGEMLASKPPSDVSSYLEILHKHLFAEDTVESDVLKRLLMHILKLADIDIMKQHVINYIVELEAVIATEVPKLREKRLIFKKITAVLIAHLFFYRRGCNLSGEVDANEIPQNAYKSIKSILKKVVKQLYKSVPNNMSTRRTRVYNCACVNLLCKLVDSSPDSAISKCLFNKDVWASIIDKEREYTFHNACKITKKIKTTIEVEKSVSPNKIAASRYASSGWATATDSLLREDIGKFDMAYASFLSPSVSQIASSHIVVELEMDEINEHLTMPSMVALFTLLAKKESNDGINFLVCTMKGKFKNAKLFVLKLIYNLQNVIHRDDHRRSLACVILNGITELFQCVNPFMVDLIKVLIAWNIDVTSSSHYSQIHSIFKLIIERPYSEQREDVKEAMDVAAKMLEKWPDLSSPIELTRSLLGMIDGNNSNSKLINYKCLRVASLLLTHNNLKSHTYELNRVFKWIKNCKENKDLRRLATECLGQFLQRHHTNPALNSLQSDTFLTIKNNLPGNITYIALICKFYPNICYDFMPAIVDFAWRENSELKSRCLDIIIHYVDHYPHVLDPDFVTNFSQLALQCLNSFNITWQHSILRIISLIITKLDETTLQNIISTLVLLDFAESEMRSLATSIMIEYATQYWSHTTDLLTCCKKNLIIGLHDTNIDISIKCLTFWVTKIRNIQDIFHHIYHVDLEDKFEISTVQILLRLAANVQGVPSEMGNSFQMQISDPQIMAYNPRLNPVQPSQILEQALYTEVDLEDNAPFRDMPHSNIDPAKSHLCDVEAVLHVDNNQNSIPNSNITYRSCSGGSTWPPKFLPALACVASLDRQLSYSILFAIVTAAAKTSDKLKKPSEPNNLKLIFDIMKYNDKNTQEQELLALGVFVENLSDCSDNIQASCSSPSRAPV